MNKKAWVVTLSKTDNLGSIKNNKPVIGILDSRYSSSTVRGYMKTASDFLFLNLDKQINKKDRMVFREINTAGLVVGVFNSFVMSACKSEIIKIEDRSIVWGNIDSLKCSQSETWDLEVGEVKYNEIHRSSKPIIDVNKFFKK